MGSVGWDLGQEAMSNLVGRSVGGVEAGVGVSGIAVWAEQELSGRGTRWNLILIKIATAR